MNKEYKFFRFFTLILVILGLNFAVLVSKETAYYYWFLLSIILLSILLIKERSKFWELLSKPSLFKISINSNFLLAFLFTYSKHYQVYRHLNYVYVIILQILNVILFTLVFCIEKREKE